MFWTVSTYSRARINLLAKMVGSRQRNPQWRPQNLLELLPKALALVAQKAAVHALKYAAAVQQSAPETWLSS